jgi:hypothetical protein
MGKLFKNVEELKDLLKELNYENTVVFDNPSYLNAIVGISDDGALCYSYEKMIKCLMEEDKMEYDDAMEFIDYNTIRALPYASSMGVRPIVIYNDFFQEE